MFIRRVKVKPPVAGEAQRVYPLPGEHPSVGPVSVLVVNLGAGPIELVDDPARAAGEGLPVAAGGERSIPLGAGDGLWALVAAGEEEVVVVAGGA